METKYNEHFPIVTNDYDTGYIPTRREYFAALAMQGMLANSYKKDVYLQDILSLATRSKIADLAVKQADALIQALEKIREV